MKKIYLVLLTVSLVLVSFYTLDKMNKKLMLDEYYLYGLTAVRYGLCYGSSVDSKEELERFEDQLQLFMHLDGYNGYDISNMKVQAILRASERHRDGDNFFLSIKYLQ